MKLIVGTAGAGKTKEMIKLIREETSKGPVFVLTDEVPQHYFNEVHEGWNDANNRVLLYPAGGPWTALTFMTVMKSLFKDISPDYKSVCIDVNLVYSHEELHYLNETEKLLGIPITLTVQANRKPEGTKSLNVFEYVGGVGVSNERNSN